MLEPISAAIAVGSAAYKLYESEFFGDLVTGVLGNRTDAVLKFSANKISKQIHDRLLTNINEPANHDVQRAVRKSYLKATLLAVEHELQRPKEDYNVTPTQIKQDLDKIKSYIKRQIELLENGHNKFDSSSFDEAYQFLINPERAEKVATQEMISGLKASILREFELEHIRTANGLRDSMANGWVENGKQVDWYKLMCAFFAEEIKTNTRLSTYIQVQYLDHLSIDSHRISVTIEEIKNSLEAWWVEYASLMGKVEEILAKIEAVHNDVRKGNAEQSIIHSKVDIIQTTITHLANAKKQCLRYEDLKLFITELKQKENSIVIEIKQWKELIQSSEEEINKQLFSANLLRLEQEHLVISQQLGEYSKDLEERQQEIAKVKETVPFDSQSKLLNEAQVLIDEEKFLEASKILNEKDVYSYIEGQDREQKEERKSSAYALVKMAQLAIINKHEGWAKAAYKYYKDAVERYESYYTCFEFGYFLAQQGIFNESMKLYNNAIKCAENDADIAKTITNLGIVQRATAKFEEAEKSYTKALQLQRAFARLKPDIHLDNLATTLNSLGVVQVDKTKFKEAKKNYTEALHIRRKLAKTNPDLYMPLVAQTLNNLGNLFSDSRKFEEAEDTYHEALKISWALAERNPEQQLPSIAAMLNNLGTMQVDKTNFEQARQSYDEALRIRRQLAEVNPGAYLNDVAMTLINLGAMQVESNLVAKKPNPILFENAEKNYREALFIRKALAEAQPKAYLPQIARTLNNLGILQEAQAQYKEAEESFMEALKIRRELAKNNQQPFNIDLATTCIVLSTLYTNSIKDKQLSLQYSQEAFAISRECLHLPLAVQIHDKAKEIFAYWERRV